MRLGQALTYRKLCTVTVHQLSAEDNRLQGVGKGSEVLR